MPARIACEYGPMAVGASGLETACFMPIRGLLGGLDDLARAQAARADADALDAAVDHRADRLEIRLEPPRAHVVRVAVLPADDRTLPADFTALRHKQYALSTHEDKPQV